MQAYKSMQINQTPAKSTTYQDHLSLQRQNINMTRSFVAIKSNQYLFLGNDLSNGNLLYNHSHLLKVKSYEREEYQSNLQIKISQGQHQTQGTILNLELTDDSNYQFLYSLSINENTFIQLKTDHQLHVDFQSFAQMISHLLELCLSNQQEIPYYQCSLEIKSQGEGYFLIKEITQFKTLIHLQLKLIQANDDTLKNHMSHKLKLLKEEFDNEKNKNYNNEETIYNNNLQIQQLQERCSQLIKEKDQNIENMIIEENNKINSLENDRIQREESLRNQYNQKISQIEEKLQNQIQNLQQENKTYLNENIQLKELKLNLERENKNFQQQQTVNSKEIEFLKQQNEQLRQRNQDLDEKLFKQEKELTKLNYTVESLNTQITEKKLVLSKDKELQDKQQNECRLLEQHIQQLKIFNSKLEEKLNLAKEEINKGNKIIEQQQSEIKEKKTKIKDRNEIIYSLQNQVKEIRHQNDQIQKEITSMTRTNDKFSLELRELESDNKQLKQKLEESRDIIEKNQEMIKYLNQQLTDSQKPMRPLSTNKFYNTYQAKNVPANTNMNSQLLNKPYNENFNSTIQYNKQSQFISTYEPGKYSKEFATKNPSGKFEQENSDLSKYLQNTSNQEEQPQIIVPIKYKMPQ